VKDINIARYDLLKCPIKEYQYCGWYEYACEIKDIREGYIEWRKAQRSAFRKIRSAIVNGKPLVFMRAMLKALDDRPDQLQLYAHPAMEFLYLFPEFPDTPYLQLPIKDRTDRIKAYEEFFGKGMYDYTDKMGLLTLDEIKKIADPAKLYLLGIDWRKGNDWLLEEFKNWLKSNRGGHRAWGLRYQRQYKELLDSLKTKRLRECYPKWRDMYDHRAGAARNTKGKSFDNWRREMQRKQAGANKAMNRWKKIKKGGVTAKPPLR